MTIGHQAEKSGLVQAAMPPMSTGGGSGTRLATACAWIAALTAIALLVCSCDQGRRAFSNPYAPLIHPVIPVASKEALQEAPSSADPWQGETELELASLVAEVLARNPTLFAMQAAFRAAAERYPQVTALEDPELSYGLAPETIGNRRLDLGQKFDLSQKLPWPGKLATRGESALREAGAAAEDIEATRLLLVAAAREAFYDWWFVHRAIAVNHENQDLLAELQKIAETRYAAGLASKQDALQAEVEHQHLVHQGVVLERMREVARARLNTLLNQPPKTPIPPPPDTVPTPQRISPREQLEAEAVEGRPVLRAQRLRIEARKADVRLAELEYLPNLTIGATYNSLWQEEELRPMGMVGINVPIQLERRHAALDEARARLHEAESLLAERRAEVLFDVSRAVDEVHEQAHVVRLYGTSIVPAAEESLAAARSGYESATNDFLTLIEAEKTFLTAQLSYEQALAEYHKARARLDRAVGRPTDQVGGAR